MGRETLLFKTKEKRDLESVATLLRSLADKIESKKVVLKQGQEEVVLDLPGQVELAIKAELEEGKSRSKKKLEVEIEWVLGQDEGGPFQLG